MYPKTLKNGLPYLFIAGCAFFMFRGIFAAGFMSGYDNSFHFYDAYYLTRTLIPQYHWISGWCMQCLAGFPVFVDYYQTGFLFIAFLNKALFLPLNFSYKITVLFSYILLGAGFYKISSHRFGKIASLLITICLMLQKDIYYDRILGGMWSNYLAIGVFFIFFHMLDRNIESMTLRKALILGLLLGLIILTHLYVAIFAFILLFIYVIPRIIDAFKKKSFFQQSVIYISIPISAIMVSSYYLYSFIAARGYFSRMYTKDIFTGVSWTLKSFFGPLENGTNALSAFVINVPVVIRIIFGFFGIWVFFKKEKNLNLKRFLINVLLFIFVALILFSDILANLFSWWDNVPFLGNLQTNRFLIYIQIGMYLFAAYGIAKFLEIFRNKKVITALCAIPILCSVFFHYTYLARDASRTLEQSPYMSGVFKVWVWVNKNISPENERIVYQNTRGNMHEPIFERSDVFALSGVFTDVPQIGVSRSASPFPQERYMRNDYGRIFGKDINLADGTFIKKMMNYFNSGHIVSVEPGLEEILNKSKVFRKEETFGPFSIFRLNSFKSEWISFNKNADYENLKMDNQRLEFDIRNKSVDNEAFVKIAYHPFWHGWLNGKPVEIKQDKYSLMKISLPEKGYHRLVLSFNYINHPLVILSLLSLVGTGLFIWLSYGERNE